MSMNVAKELAALERMTVGELRPRYEEVFGEACRTNNKRWLIRRIAWRMQANAEGDLSERARRRATELANDADLRMKAPPEKKGSKARPASAPPEDRDPRLPMPGVVLTREYKGGTIQVAVREDGFEWEGETYGSLSAVAKAITGTHTNGFHFFRLGEGIRA